MAGEASVRIIVVVVVVVVVHYVVLMTKLLRVYMLIADVIVFPSLIKVI